MSSLEKEIRVNRRQCIGAIAVLPFLPIPTPIPQWLLKFGNGPIRGEVFLREDDGFLTHRRDPFTNQYEDIRYLNLYANLFGKYDREFQYCIFYGSGSSEFEKVINNEKSIHSKFRK